MNTALESAQDGTSPLPPPITSRSEFAAAVLWAFDTAMADGARQIWCVDPDFADWPWGTPALLAQLTDWLRRPQRRLVLLARDFDEVQRRHPRFVRWRAGWSHVVQTLNPPQDLAASLPRVLVDDGRLSLQLFDPVRWRGRCSLSVTDARAWREELDAVLQRSEAAFPVNPLGI